MEIELERIEEFRKVLQKTDIDDNQFTNRELEKFIIARNNDLEKAKEQILGFLAFQQTWNTKDILNWNVPEVLKKYCPGGYCGWLIEQLFIYKFYHNMYFLGPGLDILFGSINQQQSILKGLQ